MNYAHIHLMLTHVPVIGIGGVILLLIIAALRKSNELMNMALIFAILLSLVTIPVYLTGEPAEEMVENLPSISKDLIEQHEEQAEVAFILVEVTGAIALIALIVQRYSGGVGQKFAILTLIVLIISGGLLVWTANLGGKIRHTEINSGTSSQGMPSHQINKEEGD
jgi:hypothetical protein